MFVSRWQSKNSNNKINRTTIFHVVSYGCKTWSLTLMVECRLSLFQNRVLMRIFVVKRDEVTGEWTKLVNEELKDM